MIDDHEQQNEPRHIPRKLRWFLLLAMLLACFFMMRQAVAEQNFLRADGLLALNMYDSAAGHYRKAILLCPDFDQAYSMLAWIYEMKKDNTQALHTYEWAMAKGRKHSDELIYMHYIVFLWKTGNEKRALQIAEEAYSTFPQSRNILRLYGHSLEKNNKNAEALSLWERYLELFPRDALVRNRIKSLKGENH